MSYQDAFPDFVLDVTLPPGGVDTSYRNDACPRFEYASAGVWLFVDYADPADREFMDARRFSVHDARADHVEVLLDTDDMTAVAALIARREGEASNRSSARAAHQPAC